MAYLFIDEADHFEKSIQEELEPAITAYEEKSKGKTIMASTPNRPDGLFERIEKDPNSKYKKLFLGYELDSIRQSLTSYQALTIILKGGRNEKII